MATKIKLTMEQLYNERLEDIIKRGARLGLTLTHLCRSAGIGRATPDRWRNESPLSIRLIDKLDETLSIHEQDIKNG